MSCLAVLGVVVSCSAGSYKIVPLDDTTINEPMPIQNMPSEERSRMLSLLHMTQSRERQIQPFAGVDPEDDPWVQALLTRLLCHAHGRWTIATHGC